MAKAPQSGMTAQAAAAQQNAQARQLVLATAIDEWQQIFQQTFTGGPGQVVNVPLRNVGLVKRLWIEFSATASGVSANTMTLTTLGLANFFSNVTLTDLSNQTRINTAGWHLFMVTSAKSRQPFAQAILNSATDTPVGYGSNYTNVQTAPATITASASSNNIFGILEVPLSYSDMDLRGAIFANVVNATFNLQLTINPNFFVNSTSDGTFAVYKASSSVLGTLPSVTITVYQNYLDQLPIVQGQTVLPYADLGVAYLFNNTSFSGLVQNQDNPFFYANFRDFLSTCIIYDNNSTLNAGTDINYFSLQTANYTNIIKVDPKIMSAWARQRLRQDMPTGTYYLDSRKKPISTIQYGNQALVVNFSNVANAQSALYLGYEMLANIAQVTNAGSLPGT